ncbi:MAG: DUF4401 domain-containing protein [Acidobacteriota bacterium]
MSRPTELSSEPLWPTLLEAGVVTGPPPTSDELESPWFVKLLLAFSGWLAAIFLLGFIGTGFEFLMRDPVAALFTGAVLIGAAYALLRRPKNTFFEHLALAVSLAGQALVAVAFDDLVSQDRARFWGQVVLLQALLAAIMPHFVHRVFSSFVAVVALAECLRALDTPYLLTGPVLAVVAWLWLREFRFPRSLASLRAVTYGLTLALLPLQGAAHYDRPSGRFELPGYWTEPWMGEVLSAAVLLALAAALLRRHGLPLSSRISLLAMTSLLLWTGASLEAPGITVGLALVLLGFACANRTLLGLGILALLFFVGSYYYLLDTTLLHKSQTLLAVGLALLATRFGLRRGLPEAAHG